MVAIVLLALSSRLQPGERYLHYSHGGRESIHSGEFFPTRCCPSSLREPDVHKFYAANGSHRVWADSSQQISGISEPALAPPSFPQMPPATQRCRS